jgi:hypothetical protein
MHTLTANQAQSSNRQPVRAKNDTAARKAGSAAAKFPLIRFEQDEPNARPPFAR